MNMEGRPSSSELDAMLGSPLPVLDKGFVRPVDYMGNDAAIVQAARVSYGKGSKHVRQDAGLIRYLMRNRHTSPFEMCVLKMHVKAPIFVARQWLRHRTASVNEISARYSILSDEFYIPTPETISAQSRDNKQGRTAQPLPTEEANAIAEALSENAERSYSLYKQLLAESDASEGEQRPPGIARELARLALPVHVYTEWYWRIDLHNLLHFLQLRMDEHAQYEIRAYAETIAKLVQAWVPLCWEAFKDYRLGGATLSAGQIAWLREALSGKHISSSTSAMGKSELTEFVALFNLQAEHETPDSE